MELQTSGDGAATAVPTVSRRRKSTPAAAPAVPPRPINVLLPDSALIDVVRSTVGDEQASALEARLQATEPAPTGTAEAPAVAAVRAFAEHYEPAFVEALATRFKAVLSRFEDNPVPPAFLGTVSAFVPAEDDVATAADVTLDYRDEPEAVMERMTDMVSGLTALLRTREFMDLCANTGLTVPKETHTNARIGLVQLNKTQLWSATREEPRPGLGQKPYPSPPEGSRFFRCEATGRFFVYPENAPVPALLYDEDTGGLETEYERAIILHPGLATAGAEYVLYAMWKKHEDELLCRLAEIVEIVEGLTLLLGLNPADVKPVPIARAFAVHRDKRSPEAPDGYGFPDDLLPRGWADVDSNLAK